MLRAISRACTIVMLTDLTCRHSEMSSFIDERLTDVKCCQTVDSRRLPSNCGGVEARLFQSRRIEDSACSADVAISCRL